MILIATALTLTDYGTVLEVWRVGHKEADIIERPFDPLFYTNHD